MRMPFDYAVAQRKYSESAAASPHQAPPSSEVVQSASTCNIPGLPGYTQYSCYLVLVQRAPQGAYGGAGKEWNVDCVRQKLPWPPIVRQEVSPEGHALSQDTQQRVKWELLGCRGQPRQLCRRPQQPGAGRLLGSRPEQRSQHTHWFTGGGRACSPVVGQSLPQVHMTAALHWRT